MSFFVKLKSLEPINDHQIDAVIKHSVATLLVKNVNYNVTGRISVLGLRTRKAFVKRMVILTVSYWARQLLVPFIQGMG